MATPASPTPPAPSCPRYHLSLSASLPLLRVALLDDHPATLLGLSASLRACAHLQVLHAEVLARSLLDKLDTHPCDVAIVDYSLPEQACDGIALIRRLRRRHPAMVIISFSSDKSPDARYAAFRAGANAYLLKTSPIASIPAMVRATAANRRQFYIYDNEAGIRTLRPQAPASLLSTSEIEVLRHIALGFSVTQTGQRLSRSKKTISSHKRSAMRKLGISDDLALAFYLKENVQSED